MSTKPVKTNLHPRNRHRDRYDFPKLIQTLPELKKFVAKNEYGDESIDFANPAAVKALNRALLKEFYSIDFWDLPEGYLCPPIPGRADHLHSVADILAECFAGEPPRGKSVRVLDIGAGANIIYPLIGQREYGWSFVGTDIDAAAIAAGNRIIAGNPGLSESIELRLQPNSKRIFRGVVRSDEKFALVLCNPPFHASLAEAQAGTRRKWQNLGKAPTHVENATKNFGGQSNELWYPGGEIAFIDRMIEESAEHGKSIAWFTTLVSKENNLPVTEANLDRAGVEAAQVVEMSQGQKKSRIVAWSYMKSVERSNFLRKLVV